MSAEVLIYFPAPASSSSPASAPFIGPFYPGATHPGGGP